MLIDYGLTSYGLTSWCVGVNFLSFFFSISKWSKWLCEFGVSETSRRPSADSDAQCRRYSAFLGLYNLEEIANKGTTHEPEHGDASKRERAAAPLAPPASPGTGACRARDMWAGGRVLA